MIIGFLTGCRAKLETSSQQSQRYTDEIGVELRRVDRLWSSIAERLNMKIEFYPPMPGNVGTPATGNLFPIDPTAFVPPVQPSGSTEGGIGAIKSIEITTENEVTTNSASHVDSTYNEKTDASATLQEDKTTEAKHDNGTVFIVAVAAAVVLLLALLIIIKKLFHK